MFMKIYYNDGMYVFDDLEGIYVKFIVEEKGDNVNFDYNVKLF